jgi:hypothetical protein
VFAPNDPHVSSVLGALGVEYPLQESSAGVTFVAAAEEPNEPHVSSTAGGLDVVVFVGADEPNEPHVSSTGGLVGKVFVVVEGVVVDAEGKVSPVNVLPPRDVEVVDETVPNVNGSDDAGFVVAGAAVVVVVAHGSDTNPNAFFPALPVDVPVVSHGFAANDELTCCVGAGVVFVVGVMELNN